MRYVKIISCDSKKAWYYNKIGQIFKVHDLESVLNTKNKYSDVYFIDDTYGICKRECIEVTRQQKLERILSEEKELS